MDPINTKARERFLPLGQWCVFRWSQKSILILILVIMIIITFTTTTTSGSAMTFNVIMNNCKIWSLISP